jgi:hypothetical protein
VWLQASGGAGAKLKVAGGATDRDTRAAELSLPGARLRQLRGMRNGDSGRRKRREVEDDPDVWVPHGSGSYEKGRLSHVHVGPTCQSSLTVKS